MRISPPSSPPRLPSSTFSFGDTTQRDYKTFRSLLTSSFSPSSNPTIKWTVDSTPTSTNHINALHSTLCSKQYLSEVRPIEGGFGCSSTYPIATTIPPTLDDPSLPLPPSQPYPWDGDCYIIKPPDSCNGVGISLCNTASDLQKKASTMGIRIIQKYLEHPYLLHLPSEAALTSTPNSYKFDIRQWVMLALDANRKPKLYIWGTFYVRICSLPFTLSGEGWSDPRRHFSNIKINNEFGGEVWGEDQFRNFVHSRGDGAKYESLKISIHEHIKTAVNSTLHHLLHSPPMRFELLGFDFLVDKDLKPHLCEINESPGLRRTRGGVDVTDEVDAMCHQTYDLTINKWFHFPPLPPPPSFPPHQWESIRSFGETEFCQLTQLWNNQAGRELGVDGSQLSVSATSISPSDITRHGKVIDAPEKFLIVKRNIVAYISKYQHRKRLGLTLQRLYRGRRGRHIANHCLKVRSTRRIVFGLRKGILRLKHRRVEVGLQRFLASSSAISVRLPFATMLRETRVRRASSRVMKLHLVCAKFQRFLSWRNKVRKEKVAYRFVRRFAKNFKLRKSAAKSIKRSFRAFAMRTHVKRSASARHIQVWWSWYNTTRRYLRRLINLRRARSLSVLRSALLRFARRARDKRLEMLVVKYRNLEAQEDVKKKHRLERERLRKEKVEREEEERLLLKRRRSEKEERIRREKERQAEERAGMAALSYGIKSVQTLKGISEHERLLQELEMMMEEGGVEETRGEENEPPFNNAPQTSPPAPPPQKKKAKVKAKAKRLIERDPAVIEELQRFEDLLRLS